LGESLYHTLTARFFAFKPVTDVTESDVSRFMALFIGGASAFVALAGSIVGMCGVTMPPKKKPAPETKPESVLVVDEPVWDTMTDYVRQEEEARAAKEAAAKEKAKRRREDAKFKKGFAKTEAADQTAKRGAKPTSSPKPRPSPRAASNDNAAAKDAKVIHLPQKDRDNEEA
jgi:hypothetical protein